MKIRREGRFVVVGLNTSDGYISSLLLGGRRGSQLAFVGRVEWGVTRAAVERIVERCTRRVTPACVGVNREHGVLCVEPRVVVEVSYSELLQRRLRDPVLRAAPTLRQ